MAYFDDRNYLYVHPLRSVYYVPDSYQSGISALRHHFSGVFPDVVDRYFDPFLGDGSMYFNVSSHEKIVNDYSLELIGFYELVRDRNREFFNYLNAMSDMWEFLENLADDYSVQCYKDGDDMRLASRMSCHGETLKEISFCNQRHEFLLKGLQVTLISWARRFRRHEYQCERKGVVVDDHQRLSFMECAHKAGLYEHVRAVYNEIKEVSILKVACWYFLRRYCYKNIYRKNQYGHFTSSYGGLSMNPHLPDIEIDYWTNSDLTSHLYQTELESADFMDFLIEKNPKGDDFIFVDPPEPKASSAFSESPFTYSDHHRLADYLLTECQSQWMVLLKPNRRIEDYYKSQPRRAHMMYFTKGFNARNFHRCDQTSIVMIKNY